MVLFITPWVRVWTSALVALALSGPLAVAACIGDCNGNGTVSAGELTKIITLINLCGGNASGCAAVPGSDKQCVNADRNGNGIISAGELTFIIANMVNFPGGCAAAASPTLTVTLALPSPTPTATPTPAPQAACGNGFIETGETCASCPSDCVVRQCSVETPAPTATFRVNWSPPGGGDASSTTVLIGYRSDRVSLPGSGTAPASRIKNKPSNSIVTVNDLNYGVRVVITRSSPIPAGRLLTVDFDRCTGAAAPTAADFGCIVEGCASSFGDIQGCTCTVTTP